MSCSVVQSDNQESTAVLNAKKFLNEIKEEEETNGVKKLSPNFVSRSRSLAVKDAHSLLKKN